MSHPYSEDQLIQRSTAELLEKELGWKSGYAFDQETLGENGTLGRTSYHEVLLTRHLCQALKRLNPWLTDKQLQEALERMTEHISSQAQGCSCIQGITEQIIHFCCHLTF